MATATTRPLRTMVVCPDVRLVEELQKALDEAPELATIEAALTGYPSAVELARALRSASPAVVFVGFQDIDLARRVVEFLESEVRGLLIIAIAWAFDTQLLRECMRIGVRECLSGPFQGEVLGRSLSSILSLAEQAPATYSGTSHIFAFFPARPGVGATTVAVNTAVALARMPDMKILLSDLDLSCGMLRFLLKTGGEHSFLDAVAHAPDLDEALWPNLIVNRFGMDVLHAGALNPQAYLDPGLTAQLIDFARQKYGALLFDLSGNLERYSLQVMQDCRKILLVCNPEPCSLVQAREKLDALRPLGLGPKILCVLNRVNQKYAIPKSQVEDLLQMPVMHSFSNDYRAVTKAVEIGTFLPEHSRLGREYVDFAKRLLNLTPKSAANKTRSAPAGALRRLLRPTAIASS